MTRRGARRSSGKTTTDTAQQHKTAVDKMACRRKKKKKKKKKKRTEEPVHKPQTTVDVENKMAPITKTNKQTNLRCRWKSGTRGGARLASGKRTDDQPTASKVGGCRG